ncbi:MAG: hypothetical protein JXM73_04525, partial [Anaerolineae bacterium]|nr:hypothetical protein [Anaerolineae bacterium]
RSLATSVWLTIVAWTSDWLDGPLARRAKFNQQTWLGKHDLEADLAIMLALAIVMLGWGIALPALVTVITVGGWAAWSALHGPGPLASIAQGMWADRKTLAVSTAPLQFATLIVYGGFILTVWGRESSLGRLLAGWLAVTLAFSPDRSWHRIRSYFVVTRQFLLRETSESPSDQQPSAEPRKSDLKKRLG